MSNFKLLLTKIKNNIIVLGLSWLLVGCGFKLCEEIVWPAELKYISINYHGNQHAPFYQQLRSALIKVGAIIQPNMSGSKNVGAKCLNIHIPEIEEIVSGYDSSGQISLVKVIATCKYEVLDINNNILINQNIVRTATYNTDPNKLLANAQEKAQIIEELSSKIIEELFAQLAIYPIK